MGNVEQQRHDGRAHTDKVADELLAWSASQSYPVYWMWVLGDSGHHAAGRAIDFMTLTDNQQAYRDELGNKLAAHIRTNWKRLGVEYVIWRQRIWNATRSDDNPARVAWSTWRHMEDRGNPTANHMDHVHLSLLDKPPAYQPPPKPPAPKPIVLLEEPMANPAQLVQVDGDPAVYAVTLSGAVHIKNPTHLEFLTASGQVTTTRKKITKAQLAQLLEKE